MNKTPFYNGGIAKTIRSIFSDFPVNTKSEVVFICNSSDNNSTSWNGYRIINLDVKTNSKINFDNKIVKLLNKMFLIEQLLFSYKSYKLLKTFPNDNNMKTLVMGVEYNTFVQFVPNNEVILRHPGSIFGERINIATYIPRKYWYISLLLLIFMPYYYLLEFVSTRKVDVGLYTSEGIRKLYSKFIREKPKGLSKVIPNGIVQNKGEKLTNKSGDLFNLIIIGSNTLGKGLDIAIDTLLLLNSKKSKYRYSLTIVGFYDFYQYVNTDYIIKNLSNKDFINYVGVVTNDEAIKYVQNSDIIFLPSRFEGLPNSVLEGIQNFKPYVVSKFCNLQYFEYYNSCGKIVYNTNNINEFANSIEDVTKNYEKYIDNIKKVHEMPRFSWKNISKDYYEVLFSK